MGAQLLRTDGQIITEGRADGLTKTLVAFRSFGSAPKTATCSAEQHRFFSPCLTLRLLMYIYGAPSKARNANVVYIWTYVWQR